MEDAVYYFNLGKELYASGNFEESIKAYKTSIEKDPDYAYPENYIGNVYIHLKDYSKAIEHYEKAIEKDPDFSYPENNLGGLYFDIKDYPKAIEHYNKAIEKAPNDATPEHGLGNVYFDIKDYPKAIEHYNWDIMKDFEYFEEKVQKNSAELEQKLALYIHSWSIPKVVQDYQKSRTVYEKLVQYYAMKNNIDMVKAWTLMYYVYYTEEKNKPKTLQRLLVGTFLEGEIDFLKEVLGGVGKNWITTLITIGSVQVSPITFFASLCVKFIIEQQIAFTEIKEKNLPASKDYAEFKKAFDKNVVENILAYKSSFDNESAMKEIQNWLGIKNK